MSLADIIGRMLAAGATPEAIAMAIEALQASQKSSRQARNRRYYEARKQKIKTIKTSETSEKIKTIKTLKTSETSETSDALARVEDNPSTKKLSGKKDKNSTPTRLNQTPREALLGCLSPEVADGVLAHRKAKRCPLTVRAAQLLAKGFVATADPNAAADMMIERGWQGFKPEWFDNERRSNGQSKQSGKGSIVEAGRRLTARLIAERKERELRAGSGGGEGDDAVRLLPGGLGQRS